MPYQEPEFLPWDGRRVPITFVGGYLGAGKTTAINELLAHSDRPVAVIVNDVGPVNIDTKLIKRRHGDTIELSNGCICCSSIEEMGAAFDLLRSRSEPPDHVVIELSGVAEPQRMLPWGSTAGFMLDGLVVVVAADQLVAGALPGWVRSALDEQIAAADLVILSKTDLFDTAAVRRARSSLAALAPGVPVLDGGAALRSPGAMGRFLGLGGRRPGGPTSIPDPTLFDAHHVELLRAPTALTAAEVHEWLAEIPMRTDRLVVRIKGIVETSDQGLVLVQQVGPRCEIIAVLEPEREATGLVVISVDQ